MNQLCDNINWERLKDENPISYLAPDAGGRRRAAAITRHASASAQRQLTTPTTMGAADLRTRRPLVDRRFAARSGPAAVRPSIWAGPMNPQLLASSTSRSIAQGTVDYHETTSPGLAASPAIKAADAALSQKAIQG